MTKITNISYRGIKHTPSNLSDKDGSALECVNLTQDGTDLKPMPMPAIQYDADGNLIHFPKNTTLVAVHEVTGERHYILTSPNADGKPVTLYFKDQDNEDTYSQPSWTNGSEIYAVESIGNTLVVSTANGIEYFYWKNGAYVYLGQKPPMPVLQFELNGSDFETFQSLETNALSSVEGEEGFISLRGNGFSTKYYLPNRKSVKNLEELFKPLVSDVKGKISRASKFYEPFFVRYAIRMKTGDHIMQSSPILVLPSTDMPPFLCRVYPGEGLTFVEKVKVYGCGFDLRMKFVNDTDLSDWVDIIDRIDIFATSGVSNFDLETLDGTRVDRDEEVVGLGDDHIQTFLESYAAQSASQLNLKPNLGKCYCDGIEKDLEAFDYDQYGHAIIYYPLKKREENIFVKDLVSKTLFYKLSSIGFDELQEYAGTAKVIAIEGLDTLANLPTLSDDYNSHCAMSARILQQYNMRINAANISIKAYKGYPISMYTQSANGYYHYTTSSGGVITINTIKVSKVYYKIEKDGRTIVVSSPEYLTSAYSLDYSKFLFYPDSDCFEAVLMFEHSDGYTKYITIPMKKHETLNGSYWYDGRVIGEYIKDNLGSAEEDAPTPSQDDEKWYSLPNRFAMSAVGNPWYFPIENMFEIGKREIRSLSINAEELSYAQYGQNPILVLASDGTWSLGIQGDGSPKGVSYISSDVISKMETLTDTPSVTANQATFFVTDRGLMMASGSKVIEVGRDMHGAIFDCKNELLPQNSVLPTPIHVAFNEIINKVTDNIPFADYIKGANLAWDYKHNRLLVINKAYPYVYVYDLSYDFWSKMLITDTMLPIAEGYQHNTKSTVKFTQCVNNGTELFMQDNNGYLYDIKGDIDENDIDELQYGFYVSRPMRFGADTFKTIVRLKHRMTKKANGENVKMMLYGSRDGNTFYRISTMRGSAYMYFIVVLYTTMLPAQRYAYTSFEFEDRLTNKLR